MILATMSHSPGIGRYEVFQVVFNGSTDRGQCPQDIHPSNTMCTLGSLDCQNKLSLGAPTITQNRPWLSRRRGDHRSSADGYTYVHV